VVRWGGRGWGAVVTPGKPRGKEDVRACVCWSCGGVRVAGFGRVASVKVIMSESDVSESDMAVAIAIAVAVAIAMWGAR